MPRVAEHNTSMKAHHVSLLSRWSAVPGSTVHKTQLESVSFLAQALAPTYFIRTFFLCVHLYKASVHTAVIPLLEMVEWHLSSANCPDRLIRGLGVIYNSRCDVWCTSMGNSFLRSFQLLMYETPTCLYLLEVRVLMPQARRKRRRARKMPNALSPLIKRFRNRPARLADECQVMPLIKTPGNAACCLFR